jgi:hypothetical protein
MTELVKEYQRWRKQEGLPWNPGFVPKEFDGLADLEHKYWQAEQKASVFERDRDWKKELQTKALPPARPRKAVSYVTRKQLDSTLETIGMAMRQFLDPYIKRIEELEARPVGLDYKGVWKPNFAYAKNAGVTHTGSVWVAIKDKPTKEPGEPNSGWQLACKKGRDAK